MKGDDNKPCRNRRTDAAIWPPGCGGRVEPVRAAAQYLWFSGTERRRQDHDDPDAAWADPADRGTRAAIRNVAAEECNRSAGADRLAGGDSCNPPAPDRPRAPGGDPSL